MHIDGRPNPALGHRAELELEKREFAPDESEIYPEPDMPDITGAPALPYLTPDAMLVYCQSRLTGINTQCREIMTNQEKNAKAQASLGNLLTTLTRYQDGASDVGKQDINDAYAKAIDGVGGPETALGKELIKDRDTLFNKAEKNDVASMISAAKSHQAELNSDAEIDMIRLQSLISQRQTAIQLTTNIIQSLNDQANKIVANIGH